MKLGSMLLLRGANTALGDRRAVSQRAMGLRSVELLPPIFHDHLDLLKLIEDLSRLSNSSANLALKDLRYPSYEGIG
jgi:hypothetical protein